MQLRGLTAVTRAEIKSCCTLQVQVLFTERPGHAVALARQAAANGCGVVVAVGGDGTLHEVLQGIVEFVSAAAATPNGNGNSQGSGGAAEAGEIPAAALAAAPALATLPWGTGNDFARGLGLLDGGVDPVAALSQALSRPQTPIGLCSVTYCPPPGDPAGNQQHQRRYFLNICDCGVSASASRLMPPLRRLGSTLAYSLAGALALLRHRRQCAQLRLDGGEWRELRGLALVAAGQGRFFGGSMQILPGADPRSGVLRVGSSLVAAGAVAAHALAVWEPCELPQARKVEGVGNWVPMFLSTSTLAPQSLLLQVAVLDGITLWHFLRYQRRLRAGELEGIKGVSFLTGAGLSWLHGSVLRLLATSPPLAL